MHSHNTLALKIEKKARKKPFNCLRLRPSSRANHFLGQRLEAPQHKTMSSRHSRILQPFLCTPLLTRVPSGLTCLSRIAATKPPVVTLQKSFSTTRHLDDNAPIDASREAPRTGSKTTHFGFETVTELEKTERVATVFTSVAESYDRMNDLMSFGWHRIWKSVFFFSYLHCRHAIC